MPMTRSRSPMKVSVVGAGDVVAHRLVPALLRSSFELSPDDVHVYALDSGGSLVDELSALGVATNIVGAGSPQGAALIDELVRAGRPTFVCTPPDAHYRYYAALAARSIRCAVEKPLSTVPADIAAFDAEMTSGAPHLFALSYYALEKALPVTYVLSPASALGRFLERGQGDGTTTAPPEAGWATDWRARLGRLRRLRIDLLEGVDRSPRGRQRGWSERGPGLAYETLIHPLILARNFLANSGARLADFAPRVTLGTSSLAGTAAATTFARLDGTLDDIALTLTCGKYIHPALQRRGGVATYSSGRIDFSFDAMTATLTAADGWSETLRVRAPFRGSYLVQSELALTFFREGWAAHPHDHRDAQLDALRWLLAGGLRPGRAFTYADGSEPEARGIIDGPDQDAARGGSAGSTPGGSLA